jgi:transcriptional regulator with XRE-family HTH domain
MRDQDKENKDERRILASAIRSIRKMRRMSSVEVAREMGIAPRTYEHMETGQGRYSYDRLLRFSQATNCDVVALMACVHLGDPDFAVHCANNRGMSIILLAIDDLHRKLGPDFDLLDQRTLVGAALRTSNDLEEHLAKRDVFAEHWLSERSASLGRVRRVLGKPDTAT